MTEDNGDAVTVYLYGYIGQKPSVYSYNSDDTEEDITDVEFLKMVRKYEKAGKTRLDVRINSPGGSTLHLDGIVAQIQGTTMEVHTWVDGIAASAAADIWMAAKKQNRHMAKNGKLMIHGPIDGAYGNEAVLRAAADKLAKFTDAYVAQMAADTGMGEDECRAKYYDGADHWLTAKDAVEEGLMVAMDDYEAETVPPSPEKMTNVELFKYFEQATQNTDTQVGVFKKLFNLAFPEKKAILISQPQIEEEMNIENIQEALKSGTIKEADLLAAIGAQKVAPPPAEPTLKDEISELVKTVKSLTEKVNAQEATIKALGDEPGDKPTRIPADPNTPQGDGGDGDDDALKALNDVTTKAAQKGEAVKVNGYGPAQGGGKR